MAEWLTARPVAHRGLHDTAAGVIENTASAFRAAVDGGYAIECDVQVSADGEAMVHHDAALGRLNPGDARLDGMSAEALRGVPYAATADRMMTLGELCDLVAGRVTLIVELKSRFDGDLRLAQRTAKVLAGYKGPVAAMSFDPAPVAALRDLAPDLTRGLVAQRRDPSSARDDGAPSATRFVLQALSARLQFLAYRVRDLSSPVPQTARNILGLPLLTWTVRTAEERARAGRYADQMIFEGFRP
jgi:glycerophosphoryl diester phosphodiesterase